MKKCNNSCVSLCRPECVLLLHYAELQININWSLNEHFRNIFIRGFCFFFLLFSGLCHHIWYLCAYFNWVMSVGGSVPFVRISLMHRWEKKSFNFTMSLGKSDKHRDPQFWLPLESDRLMSMMPAYSYTFFLSVNFILAVLISDGSIHFACESSQKASTLCSENTHTQIDNNACWWGSNEESWGVKTIVPIVNFVLSHWWNDY